MNRFLKIIFHHLYHSFARFYDSVAYLVSAGNWFRWGEVIERFLSKEDVVLELGFGTGHLQKYLRERGYSVFGLDESKQMVNITKTRLRATGYDHLALIRADVEHIPIKSDYFQKIISVFPSEYPFVTENMDEIWRILAPGGYFLILLAVKFNGKSPLDIFYRVLYKFFGQSGRVEVGQELIIKTFKRLYSQVRVEKRYYNKAELFFVILKK